MNRILRHILILIIWFFMISCAKQQDRSYEQAPAVEAEQEEEMEMTEITNDGTETEYADTIVASTAIKPDSISEAQLLAYQEKTKEIIYDLTDYLKLLNDNSLDSEFRIYTENLIKQLFDSSKTKINIDTLQKTDWNAETIDIEPFQKQNDSTYTTSVLMLSMQNEPNKITIYLKRNLKNIGGAKFLIWEVKLGKVKTIETGS